MCTWVCCGKGGWMGADGPEVRSSVEDFVSWYGWWQGILYILQLGVWLGGRGLSDALGSDLAAVVDWGRSLWLSSILDVSTVLCVFLWTHLTEWYSCIHVYAFLTDARISWSGHVSSIFLFWHPRLTVGIQRTLTRWVYHFILLNWITVTLYTRITTVKKIRLPCTYH